MTSIKFTDKSSVVVAKTKQAEVVSMLKTIAPAGTVIKSKATISAKKAGVTKTFGTASVDEEGDPCFDMTVNFSGGGVASDNLSDDLQRWDRSCWAPAARRSSPRR